MHMSTASLPTNTGNQGRMAPMDWAPGIAASIAMFLICMDTLITNVALPTIEAELGGGMVAQQWIVDGYTLPFAALLLLAGNLSDRFGANKVFVAGTAAFGLSSMFCALSTSAGMLVAGRVLLGISAAFILPSSMAVINEAYRDESQRRRALAFWGIGGSAASAAGPLMGGILTPIHWSLVFSVNIPFCVGVVLMYKKLPCCRRVSKPFDVLGQVLSIAGLASLVDGIIEVGASGIGDPRALVALAGGVVLFVAFIVSQAKVSTPMMPLGLLKPQGMRVALMGGFGMIFSWNGCIFIVTLLLQQDLGLSPLASGLAFVPAALTGTLGNILSDRLSASVGAKRAIMVGTAFLAAGYALLCVGANQMSVLVAAIAVCVASVGGGTNTPVFTNLVLKSVELERSGIASAIFNTMRQVGGAIGIACFGALASGLATFTMGFRVSFALALILMAGIFAMASRLKR